MSDPLNVLLDPEVVRILEVKKMWRIDSESGKKCLKNNIEKLCFFSGMFLSRTAHSLGSSGQGN
jgi:hypothetical protein